jgi:hypothetical protein
MSASSILVWACLLQQTPGASPPAAKEAKEVRGVVVEVFADNLVLVSAGEVDLAQFGDEFSVGLINLFAPTPKASARIISLGKRYSVAKIDSGGTTGFQVGDLLTSTDWERRRAANDLQRLMDTHISAGGAILINGK